MLESLKSIRINLRNEINLRESMAERMVRRHAKPDDIYAVREPLGRMYKRLRKIEKTLCAAGTGQTNNL